MQIDYREINAEIENAIVAQCGSWVHDYDCLVRGETCYLIAAMDGDVVAGFAALHMWRKLNYCMCSAAMLGQSVLPGYENRQIVGYYYAKLLH